MKPDTVKLVIFFILFSASSFPQNFLYNDLMLEKLKGIEPRERLYPNQEYNSDLTETDNNFKQHFRKVMHLRMQGKTIDEINLSLSKEIKAAGTASISGTIYKSDGITPIDQYGSVSVFDQYGKWIDNDNISTDGKYSISSLPPGSYYVKTEILQQYKNEYYNNASTWRTAELVNIADGEIKTGIDFSLNIYNGKITGHVKNNLNVSLEGVAIYGIEELGYSYALAITEPDGTFELQHLSPGFYRLTAVYESKPEYASVWYNNASDYENATLIAVNEMLPTNNINFTLEYGGLIVGEIYKPSGEPLEISAAMMTLVNSNNNNTVSMVQSEDSGKYHFRGISPGNYKLFLNYTGTENIMDCFNGDVMNIESAPIINIASEDSIRVDFHLQTGGIISGNINFIGNPVSTSVSVRAYIAGIQQYVNSGYNMNGTYSINGLPPGVYSLRASGYSINSIWYNNKTNFNTADPITIKGTEIINNVNFTFDARGYIGGYVLFNEQPVETGRVEVVDLDYNIISQADVNNIYNISGLKPGPYKLYYSGSSDKYSNQWYNDKYSFESADTVYAATYLAALSNFNLRPKGSLQGFVVDEDNIRIDGDHNYIGIFLYDALTGKTMGSTISGILSFTGGYKIFSHYSDYKLSVLSYQMNDESEQESRAVTYYGGGGTFNDPLSQTISISSGDTQTLDDIKVVKAEGSLSGSILLNSIPVNGRAYQLIVYDENGHIAALSAYSTPGRAVTGIYKVRGLRPGKYYLICGMLVSSEIGFLYQWYNGPIVNIYSILPAMNIPSSVEPVIVGTGETTGINFNFITTSADDEVNNEFAFKLEQNFPNPFNPSTRIKYSIPAESMVIIKIYDILGKEAAQLLNEEKTSGEYELNWDANGLPSGIYFCRMQAGKYSVTKKMVLVK